MNSSSSATAIVVNWNSGHWLNNCIKALIEISEEILPQIIIVDNASTDGSLDTVLNDARINIVKNSTNKGFAAACNLGAALSQTPYIILVNPDLIANGHSLRCCINFLDTHIQFAVAGTMQVDETGKVRPSCSRFPTPWRFFFDVIGLSNFAPALFKPATLMYDWDHMSSRKVDQIMGSYMCIRKSSFEEVEGFDERFFVYYEELDLSKRLNEAGYLSYYISEATVMHGGEGTTKQIKAYRLYLSISSRLKYCKKHFTKFGYSITRLSSMRLEPITRAVLAVAKGKKSELQNIKKAYSMLREEGF